MNVPDQIYEEWLQEVDALHISADMSAVQVVGELTRALKRVTNHNGGTAYIIDGKRYNINDEKIS